MNILLTIILIVSLSINIYSNTFLKTSLNKITNIYKKIKMNENPIFQIEEDTIVMHIYGKNNSVKNYTLNRYPNKHASYDFAMLII